MAIPTVHTWVSLEVPSSSTLQGQISDPITFALNPPGCIVTRPAVQSMATGVGTLISWTTEVFDNRSMFAATSDTITITETGVYSVKAWGQWATNATGIRVLELMHNGTVIVSDSANATGSTAAHRASTSADLVCAVGDTVKINTFQNSGTALDLTGRCSVIRATG